MVLSTSLDATTHWNLALFDAEIKKFTCQSSLLCLRTSYPSTLLLVIQWSSCGYFPLLLLLLRRMLSCYLCHFSGGCFAASAVTLLRRMLLLLQVSSPVDGLLPLFVLHSGYFASTVLHVSSNEHLAAFIFSLADALPPLSCWLPWWMLCRRGRFSLFMPDALPPLLLEARLVFSGWMLRHNGLTSL